MLAYIAFVSSVKVTHVGNWDFESTLDLLIFRQYRFYAVVIIFHLAVAFNSLDSWLVVNVGHEKTRLGYIWLDLFDRSRLSLPRDAEPHTDSS